MPHLSMSATSGGIVVHVENTLTWLLSEGFDSSHKPVLRDANNAILVLWVLQSNIPVIVCVSHKQSNSNTPDQSKGRLRVCADFRTLCLFQFEANKCGGVFRRNNRIKQMAEFTSRVSCQDIISVVTVLFIFTHCQRPVYWINTNRLLCCCSSMCMCNYIVLIVNIILKTEKSCIRVIMIYS